MRNTAVRLLEQAGARARAKRAETLLQRFPDLQDMRVLDIGGEPRFWTTIPVRPARVVAVNIYDPPHMVDWVECRIGDACDLPEDLRSGFDLVLSNSVIEHVGGHANRTAMAEGIRAAGTHYWVQTPNQYFPVEPHYMLPFQHWLPTPWQVQYARISPTRRTEQFRSAHEAVLQIELLTAPQMQHYFPDGEILRERIAGMTKSLIAVR